MKNTITLITLLSLLYGVHTYNSMLIFVSLVLALGVSLYWIADAVADILQQRRLKKSMENILKAVMSKEYKTNSVNFAKSIDEHNSKTDKKPKTKVTDIKKIKLNY